MSRCRNALFLSAVFAVKMSLPAFAVGDASEAVTLRITNPEAGASVVLNDAGKVDAKEADAAKGDGGKGDGVEGSAVGGGAGIGTGIGTGGSGASKADGASAGATDSKELSVYIQTVPLGTRIPIIVDTVIDSETSQEGDEFAARTSEDLHINGGIVIPAGSVVKGRIAQMNAPKHLNRSGTVALKFDTVTMPDNRQVPLVANLVASGGVIHAKRGLKDIALDGSTIALPVVIGLGIGSVAGNTSSSSSSTSASSGSVSKGEAAMIGAGVGAVVSVALICAKKGSKVDIRPGDELRIELAEDLRMPLLN